MGYVIGPGSPTAKVVIGEADVALVRDRTDEVQVRLAGNVADVQLSRIDRVFPAATERLPSRCSPTS